MLHHKRIYICFVRLHRFDEWDNRFFGISDKEAEVVDPQQHFVLESVHMALEDAGIPKEKIAGSNTGVYIGRWLNYDPCLHYDLLLENGTLTILIVSTLKSLIPNLDNL